jgi:hypothetical protein
MLRYLARSIIYQHLNDVFISARFCIMRTSLMSPHLTGGWQIWSRRQMNYFAKRDHSSSPA